MTRERLDIRATRAPLGIQVRRDHAENQDLSGNQETRDHRGPRGRQDLRVSQETLVHQDPTAPQDQRVFKEPGAPRDHQGQKEQRETKAPRVHLENLVPLDE